MRYSHATVGMIAILAFSACEEPIVPSDPANAALYQACHAGDSKSCVALGENYEHARGVGWQPERAILLYKDTCKAGYADGCRHAGFFLEKGGALVHADSNAAARYLQKACDANFADACVELASLYRNGSIGRDYRKSVALYQRACEMHSGDACVYAGVMYQTGDHVKINLTKSSKFLRSGCELAVGRACTFLGEHYFLGWGVDQDVSTGKALLRTACTMKDPMACAALAAPDPVGGGNLTATRRAWKKMVDAPSVADIVREDVQGDELLIKRLTEFRRNYEKIDCREADPELRAYIKTWMQLATAMIRVCEKNVSSQRDADNIETFAGLLGALFEKNEQGERDDISLERGMSNGTDFGKSVAAILSGSASQEAFRGGRSLGGFARQLTDYQDALAIRLESIHHVFFPPPKRKS
jgi:TPR repeat protein